MTTLPKLAARTPRRRDRRGSAPRVESLERRVVMATFLVVNPQDGPGEGPEGSLRWAISRASASGDASNRVVLTRAVAGAIELTAGQIDVAANVTIENRSNRGVVIRQATPGARVFEIASGVTSVGLDGRTPRTPITVAGGSLTAAGDDGGGILVSGATDLTLVHARVASNSVADGDGGGIYAQAGTVTLVASSVSGNRAPAGFGGGVYVASGSVVLRDGSHVDENSALNIGGIGVQDGPGGLANAVQILGGSSASRNSSTATLDAAAGDYGGGGVAVQGPGSVYVSRSQVSDNHTNGMYSAGILVTLGNVTVTDGSRVNGNVNRGPGGGIAANFLGSVVVTNRSQVNDNTGGALGGGIVNFATPAQTITVDRGSRVSGNTLTDAETIGQVLLAFLATIAAGAGGDFQSLTGLTLEEAEAAIRDAEAEVAGAHGVDPSAVVGRLVAGGGVAAMLGARVQVRGGGRVDGNFAGASTTGSTPVGIGGGIASFLGRVEVSDGSVDGNTSTEDGGGVWARRDVTIARGSLSRNVAQGRTLGALGGALFLGSPSVGSRIAGSTIRGNGSEYGGGVYTLGAIDVRDTTVSGNRASRSGGGFSVGRAGSLGLVGGSVTLNRAGESGGGVSSRGAFSSVRTRIVGNTPDDVSSS